MLGNRGYYSPNAKVYEGYRGIKQVKTYLLSILLVESALVKKIIVANSYALNNNANIDDVGNYTQGVDQIENASSIPFTPESTGYTAEDVLSAADYAVPDDQSGEDVVPS